MLKTFISLLSFFFPPKGRLSSMLYETNLKKRLQVSLNFVQGLIKLHGSKITWTLFLSNYYFFLFVYYLLWLNEQRCQNSSKSKANTGNINSQLRGHIPWWTLALIFKKNTDPLCKKTKKGIRKPLFYFLLA